MKKEEKAREQPKTQISARALGILVFAITTGNSISAERYAQYFREGEKALASSLRELRSLSLIELKREKFDGRFSTSTQITSEGFSFFNDLCRQVWGSENLLNLMYNQDEPTYSLNLVPPKRKSAFAVATPDGFAVTTNAEYDRIVEEEKQELMESQRAQELKTEIELEIARKKAQKRAFKRRINKEQVDWTPTDVSHEFSEVLLATWHVTPWEVSKSKLAPAIATARKKFETNGEIEVKMIARFFEDVKTSHIDDAEVIWKMFIYRFSELSNYVKLRTIKFGEMEDALYTSQQSLRKMFPQNFMNEQDREMYEAHEEGLKLYSQWKKEQREKLIQLELSELTMWDDEAYELRIMWTRSYQDGISTIRQKYQELFNYYL
jgi:hypothetical protein